MNRRALQAPSTFHRPSADIVELTYRATDRDHLAPGSVVEPIDAIFEPIDAVFEETGAVIEPIDSALEDTDAAWVCPTCLAGLPFPTTSCAECLGPKVVTWFSGAGLTSSLIAAVAVIGTLIVSLARLG